MIHELVAAGRLGGRTAQINERGEVECVDYPVVPVPAGEVRVRTVRSVVSPGTEMTFYGRAASNVYLHKRWNGDLRVFEQGQPTLLYPLTFGYRAAGLVVESRAPNVPVGSRLFGNWPHTEFVLLPAARATRQFLPDHLSFDDGVDIAQMGPICVNGVAHAGGRHSGSPAVVFGAGPVGIITAQMVRATGAAPVFVVERLPSRLRLAGDLGFQALDASDGTDVAATLKRRLGSEAIPVAFECTGSSVALNEAIRVVRRRGLVVALGFYQGEGKGLFLGEEFHHNGVDVRSGQIGNLHPDWTWPKLRKRTIELATSGALVLGGLPRLTLPIESVADGFEALQRPDEVLQVALAYDGPEGGKLRKGVLVDG